jgi:formate/nitrite transporter FocA (FNT family)
MRLAVSVLTQQQCYEHMYHNATGIDDSHTYINTYIRNLLCNIYECTYIYMCVCVYAGACKYMTLAEMKENCICI